MIWLKDPEELITKTIATSSYFQNLSLANSELKPSQQVSVTIQSQTCVVDFAQIKPRLSAADAETVINTCILPGRNYCNACSLVDQTLL